MSCFDEFWEKHGAGYIDHAKSIAKEDFKSLSSGSFAAHIQIDTDDDFCLKGGNSFTIYANSKKETLKKTIHHLKNLDFDNIPDWAKKEDGSLESRYSSKWTHIKEDAIKQLEKGEYHVSLGGNQTIEINICENLPILSGIKLK